MPRWYIKGTMTKIGSSFFFRLKFLRSLTLRSIANSIKELCLRNFFNLTKVLILVLSLILPTGVSSLKVYAAEKVATKDRKTRPKMTQKIVIFGDSVDQVDRGFTGQTVNEKKIDLYQFTDVHRALKQVSGVYVREEDGLGLRPNIGLRGTNPDRSKKIVFLEDDVLIGPAPFSAPAAYFTPNMNHVERLDVFKGFSAAHIGPNSVGGAINYITPQILSPKVTNSNDNLATTTGAEKVKLFKAYNTQISYGSFNTVNTKLSTSGALPFGSYLVEGSHLMSDGFKTIDGGGNTDITKTEVLTKLKWDIAKGEHFQSLEFRLGLSFEDSNETYLGLSELDFRQNPFRRYASSKLDNMNWDHQKFQIRHNLQLSETGLLESVAYRHNFNRTWKRLDRFRGAGAPALSALLNNPNSAPDFFDILTGQRDSIELGASGDLALANNHREYFSQGLQTKYTDEFTFNLSSSGGVKNSLKIEPEIFVRAHQDQILRDQTTSFYQMESDQLFATSEASPQANLEEQTTSAFTFSSKANVSYKSMIFTPILRVESVSYDFKNQLNPSSNASRTDLAFIPGLSIFKRLSPHMSIGTSYNKAASLAGLSNSGDEVKETADNFELLFKYLNQELLLQADATAFYTDYQNITGTCTVSGGCLSGSGEAFNGGQADVLGFEAGLTKGVYAGSVYIPIGLNLTYLDATFKSDFLSNSPEWGQGNVASGDPLPYIPELQYTLSLGADYKNFLAELSYTYQTKVFDQSVQAGRITIDDFAFIDLGGHYTINSALKVNYRISNLLDQEYAVAARPFGLRPGQPRALQLGIRYTF